MMVLTGCQFQVCRICHFLNMKEMPKPPQGLKRKPLCVEVRDVQFYEGNFFLLKTNVFWLCLLNNYVKWWENVIKV